MAKFIYISQRVDINPDYKENRDALDQRWADFLCKAGYIGVPVFNHIKTVEQMLHAFKPQGILLSGGNSPAKYGGTAPERDCVDDLLISYAAQNKTPLIGVCRGMQSIVLHYGGTLCTVENHVAIRHKINGEFAREVNSYHTLALEKLPDDFILTNNSHDGVAESIRHKILPIVGIMWHPERENVFDNDDLTLFRSLFQ